MESRSIFLVLCLLAAAGAAAQEAYRWVDEDGVVHYSDTPVDGAERILLPAPNVAATRQRSSQASAPTEDAQEEDETTSEPFSYESIKVVSPAAEETLWNIEGVLSVSVALEPGLQRGHRMRAYFDGARQEVSGTSFQLQEVWRGVHNIQVEVVDETGQLMIRSQPNRFYVQQNTVGF
jgi:hypothetical protein